MEPNVAAAQEFITGASILVWKWQDQVEKYDIFCQQLVNFIP